MRALSIPEKHQLKIARATLRMSEVGAHVAGGMDHLEAVAYLRKIGFNDTVLRNKLKRYGHFPQDIERMLALSHRTHLDLRRLYHA